MTIKTSLISALKTAIGLMTPGNGFNYDYGDIDDYYPASRVYPCVFINFPTEESINEDSNTTECYTNDFNTAFKIIIAPAAVAVDTYLDKVEDDFKHMMADQTATLRAAGIIDYEYIDSERTYTNVRTYPAHITINFKIRYRQQQTNPSST